MSFRSPPGLAAALQTSEGCRAAGGAYLGAGGGFAAALETHKHDDVVLSFRRSPGFDSGIHQLQNQQKVRRTASNITETSHEPRSKTELMILISNKSPDLDQLLEDGVLDHPPFVQTRRHLLQVYG